MKLFDLLAVSTNRLRLTESAEYTFYNENKTILENLPHFYKVFKVEDAFSLIQANIIITGLINKLAVEAIVQEDQEKCTVRVSKVKTKLKHFQHYGIDIYIPFLLPNNNNLYFKTPEKLLNFPYSQFVDDYSDSIIDCFDYYNYLLFESSFANLVYIDGDQTTRAYYHPNLQVIFIINNQGRADVTIHLFDKHMKEQHTENIIKRVGIVIKHYYANDKVGFVDSLFVNRLISEKLYRRIYKNLKIYS